VRIGLFLAFRFLTADSFTMRKFLNNLLHLLLERCCDAYIRRTTVFKPATKPATNLLLGAPNLLLGSPVPPRVCVAG
jgi:hypothetical protein